MKKAVLILISIIGAAGLTSVQAAQLIDVQFNDDSINRNGNPATDEGSPMPLPVMTGAAMVGAPGDFWNQVTSSNLVYTAFPAGAITVSPIALTNVDGTPSGVSMTFSAPGGTYNANSSNWGNHSPFTTAGSPYSALMQTCAFARANQVGNVTLTGLTVGQGYNLYVYTATDQNVSGGRQGTFTVNGNSQYYVWNGTTTNLVNGVSYLEFTGVASDGSGTLVITFGNTTAETDFNGFQLQAAAAGPSPSIVGNFSPDGSRFFNAATNFTFTIRSASTGGAQWPTNPISGVKVVANGSNETSTLQFSGHSTNWNVTLPGLASNTVYTISILVTNSAALVSSNSVSFDTYTPSIVIPVETYDYNSGQFIQNPIPTNGPGPFSYWGVAGVSNIDYSLAGGGGVNALATNYPGRADSNVTYAVATDLNLPLYQAQSNSAIYNVALVGNNAGNWFNYTRNPWPSGNYVAYARAGGINGAAGVEYLNLVTSGYGTANQTTNRLGQFNVAAGTTWNSFLWAPLTDANGDQLIISVPSGRQTLQLLSGGGLNVIDFMLIPIPALGVPPNFNNFNPPITTASGNAFLTVTNISFSVSSFLSTIATNNVHTYVNSNLVPETFAGSSTNWTVTFPISSVPNQIQSFAISAVDANGLSSGVSGTFDTFSQNNFMIEGEDWDFNGGQFIDNPVPTAPITGMELNSYYLYPGANPANASLFGIDLTTVTSDNNETFVYRNESNPTGTNAIGAGTEIATDFLRHKFIYTNGDMSLTTNSDYHLGWFDLGTWINYTRTFPTNNYHVYGRLASAGAYSGLTLALVTAGWGTTNQTTQVLGTFSDPNANGWQAWDWVPLLGTNGQQVVVSLGNTNTLQVINNTVTAVAVNANYYMFVPAPAVAPQLTATISGGQIHIRFPSQTGYSYTVLYSSSLTVPLSSWSTLTTTNGTGSNITVSDTISASPRYYAVKVQSQ